MHGLVNSEAECLSFCDRNLRQQKVSQHVCSQFLNLVSGKNKKLLLSACCWNSTSSPFATPSVLASPQVFSQVSYSGYQASMLTGRWVLDSNVKFRFCVPILRCLQLQITSTKMWDPAYSSSQPLLPLQIDLQHQVQSSVKSNRSLKLKTSDFLIAAILILCNDRH